MSDPVWPDSAACRDHPYLPPDAWFTKLNRVRKLAIEVCSGCELLAACRAWSVAERDLSVGIFGGLSASQRHAERKRQREAARLATLQDVPVGGARYNASKKRCDHGHRLSGSNVIMLRDPRDGRAYRGCRQCRRERNRRYMASPAALARRRERRAAARQKQAASWPGPENGCERPGGVAC